MVPHSVGTEEYNQDIVLEELVSIAYEPTLVHIHDKVVRAWGILVKKSGAKLIPYLVEVRG